MNIHVLVVEDDKDHAESIRMALTYSDDAVFNVGTSGTVQDAIEKLKSNNFDAVLLDLGLPDVSGLDAVHKVCDSRPEKTAVIVYTGWGGQENADAAKIAGADEYLVKPVSPVEMSKKLRFIVVRKQSEQKQKAIESRISKLGDIVLRMGELIERPMEKVSETTTTTTEVKSERIQ